MAYTKYAYIRVNWKNKSESLETPLGKTNLNRMDEGLYAIAENIDVVYNELEAKKVDVLSASKMLRSAPVWDKNTGILTFQFYDGTEFSIDFNIEKIPVSFSMDSSGVITMKTADGTKWTANIGDMIPDYTFEDSDRITFTRTKNSDGSYKITADIVKGSITGDYLEPNYLANVTTQASKAEAGAKSASQSADDAAYDAKLAQSYSIGGSGIRDGESTSNAKYYSEEAKKAAEEAQAVAGGDFIPSTEKGVAGGVATLGSDGKVPSEQRRKYCMVGSDVANTAGWYKVATNSLVPYQENNISFKITSTYGHYFSGFLEFQIRSGADVLSCKTLKWHTRIGFLATDVICVVDGMSYTIYVYKRNIQHGRIMFEIISESSIGNGLSGITLYNSDTPESTEPVATVVSTDGATVQYANRLSNARKIGKASFDGSVDISLANIMGRAQASDSSTDNVGKYTKIATITVETTYTSRNGLIHCIDNGTHNVEGLLYFYIATGSDLSKVTVALKWIYLSTPLLEDSIVAVKSSEGIYDLYFKEITTYFGLLATLIDSDSPTKIEMLSNQGFIDSVEAVATSSLSGYVERAIKDGDGNSIVDTYATKDEVDEVKKSVSDGKAKVADAITDKGVETATDSTFQVLADNVRKINTLSDGTADGTAIAGDIASGKTAYVKGNKVTGTLPKLSSLIFGNSGATAFENSPIVGVGYNSYVGGWDYNLHGYFEDGVYRVHIPNAIPANIKAGVKVGGENNYLTGTFTADATAEAKYMVKGYTAYANGTKLVGTLPDRSSVLKGAEGVVGLNSDKYPNIAVSPYDGAAHWLENSDGVTRLCLQAPYGVYGGAGNPGGLSGDGYVGIEVEAFGDAEASDVAEGVTFTSKNGLKLKGTATFSKETKIAKFTTSTTWTIPEGVTSIDVCCVGGGQGSGGSGTGGGPSQGGRGGDGGKVYYKTGISVTPGTSYAITVGAGGAGLAATSTILTYQTAGSDGGNSTFGSLVSSASATTRKSGGQGWAAGGTSSGTINSTAVAGTNGVYAFNDVTVDGILYGGSGAGGTSGSSVLSGGESGGGNSSTAGTANTGGGAGGRSYRNGSTYAGLSGGSGIVIVRYQI